MEWHSDFEDGQTRAACSKCGVPYRWPSELVKLDDGFFYCKRRCMEQTVKARDKIIAQSRKRREMPPPKFVQAPAYAYDYLNDEAQIFRYVTSTTGLSTANTGYAAVYLGNLVVEGRRPSLWLSRAKAKLTAYCDTLRRGQWGDPTGPQPTTASTDVRYGGVSEAVNSLNIGQSARSGLAFANGYLATGSQAYLDAADRAMMFLRGQQCTDLSSGLRIVYPASGAPYHTGGLISRISSITGLVNGADQVMEPVSTALKLCARMKQIRGGSYTYGVASSPDFVSSTVASIDTIIQELTSWATVGAKDSTGTLISPLSPSTPRITYSPYLSDGSGVASWTDSTGSLTQIAPVINGLYSCNSGIAAADAIYDYAMTFGSNPANRAPGNTIGNNLGTYDPTYTVALDVDFTNLYEATGTTLGWGWAANCAPLQSARFPALFKRAKDQLGIRQQKNWTYPPSYTYIGTSGQSGLSFQPSFANSIPGAAIVGNIYRYSPGAFGDTYSNPGQSTT